MSDLVINHCSHFTRWDLGACIPNGLLHRNGLTLRQKKIETVSLATDGSCGTFLTNRYSIDLGKLKALRSLTWKGINKSNNFHSLGECIKVNKQGMETLVLDLIDWKGTEHEYFDGLRRTNGSIESYTNNFFARDILELIPGDEKTILPHLSTLSLSAVSFQDAQEEMLHALNISRLRSLKLWNCPHSLDLLQTIVSGAHAMRLRSFELVLDVGRYSEQEIHGDVFHRIISGFLNAFRGLEDVYLMLTDYTDWRTIFHAIMGHVSTLDRLVTHERQDVGDEEWAAKVDSRMPLSKGLQDLYQNANLTCLGTCAQSCDWVCATIWKP